MLAKTTSSATPPPISPLCDNSDISAVEISTTPSTASPFNVYTWIGDKIVPPLLSGATIALITSVVIARGMERYKGRRDHLNKSVDALRTQIASLIKIGSEYWSSPASEFDAAREAEMEYIFTDLTTLVQVCAPEFFKDQNGGQEYLSNLMLVATGAQYGIKGRTADLRKPRLIASEAAKLTKAVTVARDAYFRA